MCIFLLDHADGRYTQKKKQALNPVSCCCMGSRKSQTTVYRKAALEPNWSSRAYTDWRLELNQLRGIEWMSSALDQRREPYAALLLRVTLGLLFIAWSLCLIPGLYTRWAALYAVPMMIGAAQPDNRV